MSPHSKDQSYVVRPDGNMEISPLLRVVETRHPGGLARGHDEVTKIISESESRDQGILGAQCGL